MLLDVFSLAAGRVSLVARGAKRAKSNQAPLLRPTRRLIMSWNMRSELGTLTAVEADGPPVALTGRALVSGFYLNELLIRMLHQHEPHPELFRKYGSALTQLEGGSTEERVLRIFEKHLLQSLGYGLVLDQVAGSGVPIVATARYHYRLDFGPQVEKPANARSVEVSGRTLQALNAEDMWDAEISREAKLLSRMVLAAHTGERPLASRELYKAYLQNDHK
jgi:DNA repair protein RecO (recombination protein O)